ncbi:MAG: hypothetical protein KDC92_11380 [Bacteroidetes bacterium]|nr:hypothetical protein [Bacteroidota bacterium]
MRDTFLWFLCGSTDTASSRLQGYIIHKEFLKNGYRSYIVFSPNYYVRDFPSFQKLPFRIKLNNTISIIQKLKGKNTDKLIAWLRMCGSYIIYVNCDLEYENESWKKADMLFVTSKKLFDYHKSLNKDCRIFQIPEPYEYSYNPCFKKRDALSNRVRVVWFGNEVNWDFLLPWKNIIEKNFSNDVELITCSNHSDATVGWSLSNQKEILKNSDICILPTGNSMAFSVKSPNRLIQAMAMGVPCITGPLDSYISMQNKGFPLFVARNDDEFRFFLKKLFNDHVRRNVSVDSYNSVISEYSSRAVALSWLNILKIRGSNLDCYSNFESMKNKLNRFIACSKMVGRQRDRLYRNLICIRSSFSKS